MLNVLRLSLNRIFCVANVFWITSFSSAAPTALTKGPLVLPTATPTHSYQTFSEEIERDLPLKRQVPLYITHTLGNLSIQGWVQDRIRVTIKKKIIAQSEAQAKIELKKLDLVTLETAQSFELRVGHSRGTDLVTKLRDEKQNQVIVDLEIKAPYQMGLTISAGDHKNFSLQQWRGAIALTGKNTKLDFSRLNLQKPMKVNCQNCEVSVTDSKLSGHFLVGTENVDFHQVHTDQTVFVDTTSGEVHLDETDGKFSVHTTTGKLSSVHHTGNLSFQSEDGGVYVTRLDGDMDASTQSGQVMIEADTVSHSLHLDSEKSDIQVSLPAKFEGLLDLLSLRGEVVVQFPHEKKKSLASETYGPTSPGRIDAIVGNSNAVI